MRAPRFLVLDEAVGEAERPSSETAAQHSIVAGSPACSARGLKAAEPMVAPSLPHAAEKPERVERIWGGKVSAGSMKVVLVGGGLGLGGRGLGLGLGLGLWLGLGVGLGVGVRLRVRVGSRAPVGAEVGEEEGEAVEEEHESAPRG